MGKTRKYHVRNQVIQNEGGREGERDRKRRERGRGRGEEERERERGREYGLLCLLYVRSVDMISTTQPSISLHKKNYFELVKIIVVQAKYRNTPLLSNYKNSTETENHNSYIGIPLHQFFFNYNNHTNIRILITSGIMYSYIASKFVNKVNAARIYNYSCKSFTNYSHTVIK